MKLIELTNGHFAKVDDEDFEALNKFNWYALEVRPGYIYALRGIRQPKISRGIYGKVKIVFMHREIMKTPKGLVVDHIDHDTLNNQKYNLRNCTQKSNLQNSIRIKKKRIAA